MTPGAPAAPATARTADIRHPSRARAWIHACRVPTLAASIVPVLVGTALAWRHGVWQPAAAIAALIGAVAIQVGTNFANDLYDFRKGADPAERIGPPRVLAKGWLRPKEVRTGMILAFAMATLAGIFLASVAGWPVVAIGVASIAAGVGYTAGRFALAYVGLGDLAVFLFFGFVAVLGTYFVQAGTLHPEVILAAIPVGALATAILVVNNVRDIETDRASGKRTLAVRWGRRGARAEYLALLIAAYAVPLALWAQGLRTAWILLPFATVSLAAWTLLTVWDREDGPSLNAALVDAARLHAFFGLLFAAGIALG